MLPSVHAATRNSFAHASAIRRMTYIFSLYFVTRSNSVIYNDRFKVELSRLYPMKPKVELARLLPISSILPAYENQLIYRPIRSDDPSIQELARDIKKRGVLVPLAVTRDRFIVSGHRRYAAAKLAGLKRIPCQILPITSRDPKLVELITAYNQQRHKTLDEFLRETVINANPEQTYQALIEHRIKRGQIDHSLESIELRDVKKRKKISPASFPFLTAVIQILNDNREYWPLSDRQIHYRLLNDPPLTHAAKPRSRYRNLKKDYHKLTDLLTRARLEGRIPWRAIGDETRPVIIWDAHQTPQSFVKREIDNFLKGYARDLLQSQPNHIELVGEKLTIEGIVRPICMQYCIPYTIGRGYSSINPRHDLAKRFEASGKENLILLFLSDFDPAGEEIAHSFARSIRDDFAIDELVIEPIKVALTLEQIREFELPPIMTAKASDPNYERFIERYADSSVHELDALEPEQLQRILTRAIDSVIDVDVFNAEIDAEKRDSVWLEGVRRTVHEALKGVNLD
jgi:hypothetical protein